MKATLTVHHAFLTVVCAAVAGCGCPAVLDTSITGAKSVLRVGETMTLKYREGSECAGWKDHPALWSTTDTLVVRVDSLGRVTGRSKGTATIGARFPADPDPAHLIAAVTVRVE